jgi:hypothetical protein
LDTVAATSSKYRYRDPARLTSWLRAALLVDIAVSAIYLLAALAGLALPAVAKIAGYLTAPWFVVFAIAAVLFLAWVFRAAANVYAFGADITFEPAGAIGWLLAPVLSLWMAFVVIEEIWRASIDAPNWQDHHASWAAIHWWAAWVVASLGAGLVLVFGGAILGKLVYFAGHIAYAGLLIPVVERIRDLQLSQAQRSGLA